jgi:hypothetical protein
VHSDCHDDLGFDFDVAGSVAGSVVGVCGYVIGSFDASVVSGVDVGKSNFDIKFRIHFRGGQVSSPQPM